MQPTDFELIFAALEREKVRFLVAGGVAVVLHGVPRFTAECYWQQRMSLRDERQRRLERS